MVVGLILFPMPIPDDSSKFLSGRQAPITLSRVNLLPFDYGQFRHLDPWIVYLREILDIIVLTLPFGFGICWIKKIRVRELPWWALGVGLSTETAQLVMCVLLGSQNRGIDINDTIMNAMGVLIGYLLFWPFSWLYLTITRRFKINQLGLLAYLHTQAIHFQSQGSVIDPKKVRKCLYLSN